MTVPLSIPVENIDEVMETYESIQVYRDTTPTGSFSTLVTTITLVADQTLYEYEDTGGSAGDWYRHRFRHSTGPVVSSYSAPWRTQGLTLKELRISVAEHEGMGFRGTADASSTTTLLIDSSLGDSGVDSEYLEGTWIYRPGADAADKLRRTSSFNTSSLGLVPTRAWGTAPSTGEAYHVFLLLPPVDTPGVSSSYDRAIRFGLQRVWYEDELPLATGTTTGKQRFDVSAYMPHVHDLYQVLYRRTDSQGFEHDIDAGMGGGYWRVIHNGRFGAELELSTVPADDETVIGRVFRHQEPVYRDDDVTDCPAELAIAAGAYGLFWMMTKLRPGSYSGELATAEANFAYQGNKHGTPTSVVVL